MYYIEQHGFLKIWSVFDDLNKKELVESNWLK